MVNLGEGVMDITAVPPFVRSFPVSHPFWFHRIRAFIFCIYVVRSIAAAADAWNRFYIALVGRLCWLHVGNIRRGFAEVEMPN